MYNYIISGGCAHVLIGEIDKNEKILNAAVNSENLLIIMIECQVKCLFHVFGYNECDGRATLMIKITITP